MRYRWAALAVVLTLTLTPQLGKAQGTLGTSKRPAVTLGQNFPNPFNPETRIPFEIGCTNDPSQQFKVSVSILNVLAQFVAVPVLQGGTGSVAGGQPLQNVLLTCGQYTAYWNGNYRNTSNEVASGIYMYVIEVDGQKTVKKMLVTK
ncbi:MAG: hypothetical protein P3B98_10860 [Gemmatimonadota bacterium]|nr:hypothetical protein [Gemmatimonadota bacterium]